MNFPGPDLGFTDILDEAITKHLTEERKVQLSGDRNDKNSFFPLRPSAAGHCARKLAYDLSAHRGFKKYEREIFTPNVYRLLNLGYSIEYSAIRNFNLVDDLKILFKQQTVHIAKLRPIAGKEQEMIQGSCDGLFWYKDYKVLFDVKSQKDGWSVAYKTRWDEKLDEFKNDDRIHNISDTAFYIKDFSEYVHSMEDIWLRDNLLQINLYGCTDFFQKEGIDCCSIFKYDKNQSRHYELRFTPCKKIAKIIIDKFNKVNQGVGKHKRAEVVPRQYPLGSKRCAFCQYSKECWGGKDALKEWFRSWPKKVWPMDVTKMKKKDRAMMDELLMKWEDLSIKMKEKDEIEKEITTLMHNYKTEKIKLEDGKVYQAKYLKTDNQYRLRRSKL